MRLNGCVQVCLSTTREAGLRFLEERRTEAVGSLMRLFRGSQNAVETLGPGEQA